MSIKRYFIRVRGVHPDAYLEVEEDEKGEWVAYVSHAHAVAAARREALEEAAKEASERARINIGFRKLAAASGDYQRAADFDMCYSEASLIAGVIRALAGKEASGE